MGNTLRAVRSRAAGSALVLTYHRVIDLQNDPESLCIPPSEFDEQIASLTAGYNVLSAASLCDLLRHKKRIPARSVVITFDDGYFDLLAHAKPILERHEVPATAFISTAEIGTDRERWWDELAYLCLQDRPLPNLVKFTAGGRTFEQEARDGNAESHALYSALLDHVWPLDAASRDEVLSALFDAVGQNRPRRAEYRSLNREEIRALSRDDLIEIGAHTVSHQMLSAVGPEEQRLEIEGGRAALEDILGSPVTLFSYPYGGRSDVGSETRSLVEQAGFSCAFASWFGLVFPWTDRLAVPRCAIGRMTGAELSSRLDHWFSLGR